MRAWAVLMLTLSALLLAACGAANGTKDASAMETEGRLTDFATLQPPDSPNTFLVAPPGFTRATPDETAPEFAVDAPGLAEAWRVVLTAQPRTTIAAVSPDGLQIEAEQRSAVFGFVDDVSFRAIPLAPDRSTLAVYSRSRVGYWDMGVNRGRVRGWLALLRQKVAATPPPAG